MNCEYWCWLLGGIAEGEYEDSEGWLSVQNTGNSNQKLLGCSSRPFFLLSFAVLTDGFDCSRKTFVLAVRYYSLSMHPCLAANLWLAVVV